MNAIEIRNLSKSFRGMYAVDHLNMLNFAIAVLERVFVADDCKSGYAMNLFTVRAAKSDHVISKTLVCFVGGALIILFFGEESILPLFGATDTNLQYAVENVNIIVLAWFPSLLVRLSILFLTPCLFWCWICGGWRDSGNVGCNDHNLHFVFYQTPYQRFFTGTPAGHQL